jgi:hypothetical protein
MRVFDAVDLQALRRTCVGIPRTAASRFGLRQRQDGHGLLHVLELALQLINFHLLLVELLAHAFVDVEGLLSGDVQFVLQQFELRHEFLQ